MIAELEVGTPRDQGDQGDQGEQEHDDAEGAPVHAAMSQPKVK